jgi:hypothetical protein
MLFAGDADARAKPHGQEALDAAPDRCGCRMSRLAVL